MGLISWLLSSIIHPGWISLIFAIAVGFSINKIYIRYAQQNVEIIKQKYNDPETIKEVCNKKGGVNALVEVLVTIFIIGGLVLLLTGVARIVLNFDKNITSEDVLNTSISSTDNYYDDENEVNNDTTTENTLTESATYNGVFQYINCNIEDEFKIAVPEGFKETLYNEIDCMYAYSYDEDEISSYGSNNYCEFSLYGVAGYVSAEDFITQLYEYNIEKANSEIETTQINDIEWLYFSINEDGGVRYYYGMNKDSGVYIFDFAIGENADQSLVRYLNNILYTMESL